MNDQSTPGAIGSNDLLGGEIAAQCCPHCDDSDGLCVFPYYGVAPHTHDLIGGWVGSTRVLPKSEWGDNFREDPECEGQGTYLRCPHCGAGELLTPNTN